MTEDDFKIWKQSEVTKLVMKALDKEREFMKENLVQGVYEDSKQVQGICKGIENILKMDFEGLVLSLDL